MIANKHTTDYWAGYRRALQWAGAFLRTKADEKYDDPLVEALLSSLGDDVSNPDVQEDYEVKKTCVEMLNDLRMKVNELADADDNDDEAINLQKEIIALSKRVEAEYLRLQHAVEFVAKVSWRADPPNANLPWLVPQRFDVIKWYPLIKSYGEPHAELAAREGQPTPGSKPIS